MGFLSLHSKIIKAIKTEGICKECQSIAVPTLQTSKLFMLKRSFIMCAFLAALFLIPAVAQPSHIPLSEHPRPDFQREQWKNLNGYWNFRLDRENLGEIEKWFVNPKFNQKIMVPFPWGARLSEIPNTADIGWYNRMIEVPEEWKGKRIFLIIGASDWRTSAWINGNFLGTHQGGYTPFEFELTKFVKPGQKAKLVLRVDDTPHDFKLEGKQGYGEAKGIWQTPYLEARGALSFDYIHFVPDIDKKKVTVKTRLNKIVPDMSVQLQIDTGNGSQEFIFSSFENSKNELSFNIPISNPHLWNLNDPFLYNVKASLIQNGRKEDEVFTYFGMRKVSIMNLPGTNYPYVAINNKPVYLQLTLDQSYNPDGFYTFQSDEFIREEIMRAKQIGLNGIRIHIKAEIPRKLYWADKLGLLIMADVPNFWGEPDTLARKEWNVAMQGMIRRDYNHPSIFSWVLFNETWGLFTHPDSKDKRVYLPETQEWVASRYTIVKSMDPTRLVEDNSPCNEDHVITDLNSWHAYLPGYKWKAYLDTIERRTYPGSSWNFVAGKKQGNQPMLNSECGNVWGYEGGSGDVDWSWDYHRMLNEFRRHPKCAGWLYTELHDVVNEWNGYYKYNRSNKVTGLDSFIDSMKLNDLHSMIYVSTGSDLCRDVKKGDKIEVPLFFSCMTDQLPKTGFTIKSCIHEFSSLGEKTNYAHHSFHFNPEPYSCKSLEPLKFEITSKDALLVLTISVEDTSGRVFHRNFTTFRVSPDNYSNAETVSKDSVKSLKIMHFPPNSFSDAHWTLKQWEVLNGLKVNGAGCGYFEYTLSWPEEIKMEKANGATLIFEASAKKLFGKDIEIKKAGEEDYMRGQGEQDPSLNPNSYPMTDSTKWPSKLKVLVNGIKAADIELEDDPADHRGILSWHSQPENDKLIEAGSYGYLCKVNISPDILKKAVNNQIKIRFEVDSSLPGGLALYGRNFGRYPLDPTLIITYDSSLK